MNLNTRYFPTISSRLAIALVFLLGAQLMPLGAASPTSLVSSARSLPVSELVNKISMFLSDAVDSANLSVKSSEEEVKGVEARAHQLKDQCQYAADCFVALGQAEKCLRVLRTYVSSENYQNINNMPIADSAMGFVADGQISDYLRQVGSLGLDRLMDDLQQWGSSFLNKKHKRIRLISAQDIQNCESLYYKKAPDLVSCVLFWKQLQQSASPCFRELLVISETLGSWYARCNTIGSTNMSILQRAMHRFSLAPEPGTCLRRFLDFCTVTKSKNTQDKQCVDRAMCAEFGRTCGVLVKKITKVNRLLRERQSEVSFSDISGKIEFQSAVNMWVGLFESLNALKIDLMKQYDNPEQDIVSMVTVRNVLEKAMKELGVVDISLRKAISGHARVAGLTINQRIDLATIREHAPIFNGGSLFNGSSLHQGLASCLKNLKNIFPSGSHLQDYWKSLSEHLDKFEQDRKKSFAFFKYSSGAAETNQSRVINFLSLGPTADCVAWLASVGFPIAISHIGNASRVIDEGIARFEMTRIALARQLQTVRSMEERLMPMQSLRSSRHKKVLYSFVGGDCEDRCSKILQQHSEGAKLRCAAFMMGRAPVLPVPVRVPRYMNFNFVWNEWEQLIGCNYHPHRDEYLLSCKDRWTASWQTYLTENPDHNFEGAFARILLPKMCVSVAELRLEQARKSYKEHRDDLVWYKKCTERLGDNFQNMPFWKKLMLKCVVARNWKMPRFLMPLQSIQDQIGCYNQSIAAKNVDVESAFFTKTRSYELWKAVKDAEAHVERPGANYLTSQNNIKFIKRNYFTNS